MTAPGSVIVAGAGPAGALLAFLLARGGVEVTLVERHSDFSREFRGEGMSPAGMAAIRAAGLGKEFDSLPATALESMALYSNGRPFLSLDIDRILHPGMEFLRVLSQEHLLEMLVGEAARFPTFRLARGELVHEPIVEAGRVVGIRIGERGGEDLRADYVIAADGRYSTLRKRLGLELAGEPQVFDVVWCKVPRPAAMVRGRVYSFLLDDFFALAFPTENDQVQIGRIIPKGTYKAFRGEEKGEWYERVAAGLPPAFAASFLEVCDDSVRPALLDVVCGSMPEWSAPGICFVGDAAHPMSPIGAQGINIALRDAVVAANVLGPPLFAAADGAELDRAAAAFEAARRPEVDKLQQQQTVAPKRLARAKVVAPVLRAIPDPWVAAFARWVIGLRSTRNFIEGASSISLTFGKPAA